MAVWRCWTRLKRRVTTRCISGRRSAKESRRGCWADRWLRISRRSSHRQNRLPKPQRSLHWPELDTARSYEACQRYCAQRRGSNFYYAFFLLPKPKRDGLAALYAFMRLIDDVADEGDDLAIKQRGLRNGARRLTMPSPAQRQDGNASCRTAAARQCCPRWSTPFAATTCRRDICTI